MRQAQGEGIGISVPRLEDDRYLRGKGEFIADIRLPGMRDLAFVRSPVAHARIRAVRKPPGAEADGVHRSRSRPACSRSSRCPVCLVSSHRFNRCWPTTRCAMSAKRSPSAWPTAGPRPRTLPRRWRWSSTNCRRWSTCARRSPAKPGCTSTGTTTSFWRPSSRLHRSDLRARRRSWCGGGCARRGNACRRSKAAVWSRPGTGGWSNCWSTPRPKCRTSCAPGWRAALASTRGASASSRPTSAAASATRASCCRKKCARPGSRGSSAIRCAGSRIAASN